MALITSKKGKKKGEKGATMLEYALMASLVGVVAIGAVTYLGEETRRASAIQGCFLCALRLDWWPHQSNTVKLNNCRTSYDNDISTGICRRGWR